VNMGSVLDYYLIIHATTIRSSLYGTVSEIPPISAGLERGTANFSTGHLLPLTRPDYLHESSLYYGLSGEPIGPQAENGRPPVIQKAIATIIY
jgi:hypothetical protein